MIRRKQNPTDKEFLSYISIKKKISLDQIYYHIYYFDKDIGIVGYLPQDKVVIGIVIDDPYRRKGLATYVYDYIEKDQNVKIKPSQTLSYDGKAFWKNRLTKKNPKSKFYDKKKKPDR